MTEAIWVVVCLYAFYVVILFFLQRRVLFPGVAASASATVPSRVERIWLQTPSECCEAWLLTPASAAEPFPVLLFFHGNAELIDDWPELFRAFTSMGLGVLLVEYPGYGRSRGRASQRSLTRVAVAAHDHLASRGDADSGRIIPVGRSLGGGVACQLLSRRRAPALILMSSFCSVKEFARGMLYPPFAVRDPLDNLAVLRDYSGAVLIIHGNLDPTVPVRHARRLAETAQQSELILQDCGHNDCPPDWEEFCQLVQDFLRRHRIL